MYTPMGPMRNAFSGIMINIAMNGTKISCNVLGDDLLQPLPQETERRSHEQGREHRRTVIEDGERHAEDRDRRDLRTEEHARRRRWVVGQRAEAREHHDRHDREPDPRVGAELLRRVVGDHQRQEDEDALPHEVDELPRGRKRRRRVGPVADDTERGHQRHEGDEQRCTEQRAEDRTERVGQELEERVEPRRLASDALLPLLRLQRRDVVLIIAATAAPGHRRKCIDVLIDGLNGAADDDLVPITRLRHGAHDTRNRLDGCLVDAGGIVKLEAQPRRAVSKALDVAWAADRLDDLFGWTICHGALLSRHLAYVIVTLPPW